MSKQRQKGTAWESEIVKALNGNLSGASHTILDQLDPHIAGLWRTGLVPDARRTGSRAYELGDIEGVPGFAIEAKNQKKMALSGWVDQAVNAAERFATPVAPLVVHKRARRNVLEAYATLPLWALAVIYESNS